MQRTLVIGGTGMLQACCKFLIEKNHNISIVGRNSEKLNYFNNQASNKKIHLINADYTNVNSFLSALELDINQNGIYNTVLCWMHNTGTESLKLLIKLLATSNSQIDFFHVLGSYSSQKPEENYIKDIKKVDSINYRKIVLGYKRENNYSRWLTHKEISEGTLQAMQNKTDSYTIGQTEPWELRP